MRVLQSCDGFPKDWEKEVDELDSEMNGPDTSAAVHGSIGWILLRFSHSKLLEVEKFLKEANVKEPENLHWLFGLAVAKSSIRRNRDLRSHGDEIELKLWSDAEAKVTESVYEPVWPLFRVRYAEALLSTSCQQINIRQKCLQLVRSAHNFCNSNCDLKHVNVLSICIKVCRVLWLECGGKKPEASRTDEENAFFRSIEDMVSSACSLASQLNECYDSPRLCEQIGRWYMQLDKLRKAKEYLSKAAPSRNYFAAQKLIDLDNDQDPYNRVEDLSVNLESSGEKRRTMEEHIAWMCQRYDSLRQRISTPSHAAHILGSKGYFLATNGCVAEGLECITWALNEYAQDEVPSVKTCLSPYKWDHLETLLENSEDFDAKCFRAKSKSVRAKLGRQEEARQLTEAAISGYRECLLLKPSHQLSIEQLGILLLETKQFDEAKKLFESLDEKLTHRSALIADSVLSKLEIQWQSLSFKEKQDGLAECVKLECKNAGDLLKKFLLELNDEMAISSALKNVASLQASSVADSQVAQLHQRAQYELTAGLLNLHTSSTSFFIKKRMQYKPSKSSDGESSGKMHEEYRKAKQEADNKFRMLCKEIKKVLELDKYPRKELLKATRHHLKSEHEKENKMLKLTLENSHKAVDHAWKNFNWEIQCDVHFRPVMYFPFAYKKSSTYKDHSEAEMEKQIAHYQTESDKISVKSLRDDIEKHFERNKKTKNLSFFPATMDSKNQEAKFLVEREYKILSSEGAWIILWVWSVNEEKHAMQVEIDNLEEKVRRLLTADGAPRSVYELAHRAAEFAEETRLVLDSTAVANAVASAKAKAKQKAKATVSATASSTDISASES